MRCMWWRREKVAHRSGSPSAGTAALDGPLGRKEAVHGRKRGRTSAVLLRGERGAHAIVASSAAQRTKTTRVEKARKRPHIRQGPGNPPNARGSRNGGSVGRENKANTSGGATAGSRRGGGARHELPRQPLEANTRPAGDREKKRKKKKERCRYKKVKNQTEK